MDLKNWYREQLKDKITLLNEEKTIYPIDRERSIESIRLTVHSLKGSGGTFGFNEITKQAKFYESLSDFDLIDELDVFIEFLENVSVGNDNFIKKRIKTVLFIDDDADLLHLMSISFEKYEIDFEVASTYAEAKEKLEDLGRIDYIVQDMVMPDIDGKTLLTEIKSQEKFDTTPVTVLSGSEDKDLISECLALGAETFVLKPFNPTQFVGDLVNKLNSDVEQKHHKELFPKHKLEEKFGEIVQKYLDNNIISSIALVSIGYFQLLLEKYGEEICMTIFNSLVDKLLNIKDVSDVLVKWDASELIFIFNDTVLTNSYELIKIELDEFSKLEFFPENQESFFPTYHASLIEINSDITFTTAYNKVEKLIAHAEFEGNNQIVYDDTLIKSGDTVVLVDDDSLILSILMHKFEKSGYTVKCFDDGEQALNFLKQNNTVSVVISDIKMPAMDGFQLLEILRDLPVTSHIPIMMVSSLNSEDDIIKAMSLEADDFVRKPFSPDEVVARATRMISRSKKYND